MIIRPSNPIKNITSRTTIATRLTFFLATLLLIDCFLFQITFATPYFGGFDPTDHKNFTFNPSDAVLATDPTSTTNTANATDTTTPTPTLVLIPTTATTNTTDSLTISSATPTQDPSPTTPADNPTITNSNATASTDNKDPNSLKWSVYNAMLVSRITIITSQFAFVATLYVLFRIWRKWEYNGRPPLSMGLRVPLYIGFTDIYLYFCVMLDIGYVWVHLHPWGGDMCKLASALSFAAISFNTILVICLAGITYLRVCKKIYIDLGRYDWKLFAGILGITLMFVLIAIPSYGSDTYWCLTKSDQSLIPILMLTLNFSGLALVLFFYINTILEVNRVKKNNSNATEISKIEQKVSKKIASYVLIYLIQWTPVMVYIIIDLEGLPEMWMYITSCCCISFGGLGNAIQFMINEGFTNESPSSSSDQTINSQRSSKGSHQMEADLT